MKTRLILLSIISIYFIFGCTGDKMNRDVLQKVDPFIGTAAHGHTFPGATAPFGMVQLSPDTRLEGWDGCSGYHYSDSIVYGFSHTHLSGTGVADYCDILLKPCIGDVHWNNGYGREYTQGYYSLMDKSSEIARPGFYSVVLEEGISVELTSGPRSGFHRYVFENAENPHIILDLEHRDPLIDTRLEWINDSTIAGLRRSSSWAKDQILFFYMVFDQKWIDFEVQTDSLKWGERPTKAVLNFPDQIGEIKVKVGISAVDIEGAKRNLEHDIPAWGFQERLEDTEELWRKALMKIEVKGKDDDETIFYTSLYHSMIAPNIYSDVDGRYRSPWSKYERMDYDPIHQLEPDQNHYTVFSLWDTYRATHPLFTIIERERTLDFIQTFLRQYKEGDQLPVWELAGNYTGCMIGYHAVSVITDAYAKGIREFDTELALEAMLHSARQNHLGLDAYMESGYISSEDEAECVSKTLEYAYDDWCIAQFAKAIGNMEVYDEFTQRAQSYKNLFDPSDQFLKARMNGRWYSPFQPEEVNFNYTEANGWQYSLAIAQDVLGYKELLKDDNQLEKHLDSLFESSSETSGRRQSDITGLIGQYAHGNEPSHHVSFLYNFTDSPWKTQKYSRQICRDLYSTAPDGLSGNEDCGQMSSWYVMSSMGLYAVSPGANWYALTSPVFKSSKIHLENGNIFNVQTTGEGDFIQSVELDGRPLNRSYINHDEIMSGSTLAFTLGVEPKHDLWSTKPAMPPSAIEENLISAVPFIKAESSSFSDSLEISLGCSNSRNIKYRILSKNARSDSFSLYQSAFWIYDDSEIEAFSYAEESAKSQLLKARFKKVRRDKDIKLFTDYAPQYSASGMNALIDGIRGGNDFRTGAWQGYQGVDVEFELIFDSEKAINTLGLSCLQDINSWIWFPVEVKIEAFDGKGNLIFQGGVLNDFPESEYGSFQKEFRLEMNQAHVKSIELKAVNYGPCPDWHLGKGGKSWIFIDEVLVD